MPDLTFNTTAGQTINRELLVVYLNTGTTSTPTWSPLGKRVEDSSVAYDFDADTMRDILGNTYGSMKKPIVTQEFDPWPFDGGDAAQVKLWNLAVKDHDVAALSALDMLVVHWYAGTASTPFAEHYDSCMIDMSEIGGEGGGEITGGFSVTFGGERTTGTASKDSQTGAISFTPDS